MTRLNIAMLVVLDNGEELKVAADARDWSAMEMREFPAGAVETRQRFLAWAYLKRTGAYPKTWERFNTVDCVDASGVGDADVSDESEDEQGLDPGQAGTDVG
jgi:hypothetical protein